MGNSPKLAAPSFKKALRDSFKTGPTFRTYARQKGATVMLNGPHAHPYPKQPVKELEIGLTTMKAHGGYWDFFTIFKRQEQAWLQTQKQRLRQSPSFQKDLRDRMHSEPATVRNGSHRGKAINAFNKLDLKSHVFKKMNERMTIKENEDYNKLCDLSEASSLRYTPKIN